ARELAGAIRGEKGVFITHILGSRTTSACPHASKAAQTEAKAQREGAQAAKAAAPSRKRARSPSTAGSVDVTAQKKIKQTMLRTYTGNDMPFSAAEVDAIEAQALRAIISSNSPFRLFEDPEMLTLFGMMRSQGPQILPSAKVIGGRLFNEGSESVEAKLATVLKGKNIGVLYVRDLLTDFAITLLKIVVNQAGCERVFSDLKVKQTQRRNRLKLEKLGKMTKV
ncbi:hypothetical protein B0H14DRAFT_2304085, partial [Mycena olivaceomarginata]